MFYILEKGKKLAQSLRSNLSPLKYPFSLILSSICINWQTNISKRLLSENFRCFNIYLLKESAKSSCCFLSIKKLKGQVSSSL